MRATFWNVYYFRDIGVLFEGHKREALVLSVRVHYVHAWHVFRHEHADLVLIVM
jgi:hypothetical protein